MYHCENALSHRNSTYTNGIPVVSKLKPSPQQNKLKFLKCQNYANLKQAFKFFIKSLMFFPHKPYSGMV